MAVTQIGQAVVVGFNGVTYADFTMEDASEAITGDIEEIRDADNEMSTKLISNKGHRMRVTGVIQNDGSELSTLRAIEKGDTLTVNSIACMVEDVDITFGRLAARATITVIDDAISYS